MIKPKLKTPIFKHFKHDPILNGYIYPIFWKIWNMSAPSAQEVSSNYIDLNSSHQNQIII